MKWVFFVCFLCSRQMGLVVSDVLILFVPSRTIIRPRSQITNINILAKINHWIYLRGMVCLRVETATGALNGPLNKVNASTWILYSVE